MSNLARYLVRAAETSPHAVAVRQDDLEVSYRQLHGWASRIASGLQSWGLEPGDRVGLVLPNVAAYPKVFYGVLLAGGVVVPMNPLLKGREMEFYFNDSQMRFVVAIEAVADEVSDAADACGVTMFLADAAGPLEEGGLCADGADAAPVHRDDDDTAVILYTSGTTGKPKGAELTHANLSSNAEVSVTAITSIGPDDVVMGCLPLFHVFGLTCGLNATVVAGATITLIPRFDPARALEVIQRDGVTVFEGVPTMYAAMLNLAGREGYDTSTLRACISGGAPLPVEVLKGFEEAFGCMILEGYGLSETSPVASFNQPHIERKPGSIGVPVPGVEMRLVDGEGHDVPVGEVGEIAIRGDNLMKGYWGRPDATAEAIPDGWFRSGDLATVDKDGYFFIVDRKKDMIIRGGYNVYPREIEEVLYEHPDVLEAAVVGIPDDLLGEEVGAAVALRPGASAGTDDVRDFVKERVAAYKYPRHVWVVDELPKGPTGKILRREVKAPSSVTDG